MPARDTESSEQSPTEGPFARVGVRSPYVMLAISLVGFSIAAPLIRLSAAPALVIGAWRLGFTVLVIAGILIAGGGWRTWRTLSRRNVQLSVAAGVLLALHFWSWNASLDYTTIAASVTLVNLQPVMIAAFSARWLGERASRRQWVGIGVGMIGVLIVGMADLPGGIGSLSTALSQSGALFGDLLALIGAATGAAYFLIGRTVRRSVPLWPYVGLVYGTACVICILLSLVTSAPLAQPPRELAIFAGLAAGPMLIGHTGLNWALGYLPAYVVNLTLLGEPLGATLLGAMLPGIAEVPSPLTLVGGAVALSGVILAARRG